MTRYARRKDSNQPEITAMAHACGFITLDTSAFGNDFPDMMVAFEIAPGRWLNDLWEVKTLKGKLREGQSKFFEMWPGPKCVIRSLDDVQARREFWLKEGR
jgi:hypothetical protein